MRRVLKVVGLIAVVAIPVFASPVPQSGPLSSDVKIVDAALYDALLARDEAQVSSMLDNDFMLTNTLGLVYDKKAFLAGCCAPDSTSKTKFLGSTETQVKKYGDTSIVFARTEMRFGDAADQKLVWRSTRVYVKSGGRWKLVAEQRTTM